MAVMRCARLQKELGCGTRRRLQTLRTSNPERIVFSWPWLRRSRRVPRAGDRKAGSRDSAGNHPTEASGTHQEKSAYLPVLRLRRTQDIRRPSVPAMLAYVSKEIGLTTARTS